MSMVAPANQRKPVRIPIETKRDRLRAVLIGLGNLRERPLERGDEGYDSDPYCRVLGHGAHTGCPTTAEMDRLISELLRYL